MISRCIRRAGGVRESPPWDLEDRCGAPSGSGEIEPGARVENIDDGPPPLSQVKISRSEGCVADAGGAGVPSVEGLGGKSTPSTLSDEVDDGYKTDSGAGKSADRGGIASKKRPSSKGGESEEHDGSEEGRDTKRKPRKSARLVA